MSAYDTLMRMAHLESENRKYRTALHAIKTLKVEPFRPGQNENWMRILAEEALDESETPTENINEYLSQTRVPVLTEEQVKAIREYMRKLAARGWLHT